MVIGIHRMTLEELPQFEMYEEGSQVRRSSKSNIVEGYGRKRYKQDYVKYLTYAHGSVDETKDHLETLHETCTLQLT